MKVQNLFFLVICFVLAAQMGAQSISISLENANAATMNKVHNAPLSFSPKWNDYWCGPTCCNGDIVFKWLVTPSQSVSLQNLTIQRAAFGSNNFSNTSFTQTLAQGHNPGNGAIFLNITLLNGQYQAGYRYKLTYSVMLSNGITTSKTAWIDYKSGLTPIGNYIGSVPMLYVGGVQCPNADYDYDPFLTPVVNAIPVAVPNLNIHIASSQGTHAQVKLLETNSTGVPLNGPYNFLAAHYLEESTVGFGLLAGVPNIAPGLHYFKITLIKGSCNTDGRAKTFFVQYTKPSSTSGSNNTNNGNNGN